VHYSRHHAKDPISMMERLQRLLRLDRLERRLFGWLLLLTLVPLLTLLAVGFALGARSLQWVGTFGPWDSVAESGRVLVEAAAPAAATDPALARALEAHRQELSSSVLLARRWAYLGDRLAAALPFLAAGIAFALALIALWVGRRLSVQLARPIKELAGWADAMARGEPLPAPRPAELREVREVRALREAMRLSSVRIAEARQRALETERVRAWGEMARRVAHEMKNPLTPLRLAAHRLARHPDAGGPLREPLEVIEEEVARLDELARQFAVLGRPSAGPASDVDVRELLQRLLDSDVPPEVETRLVATAATPMIRAHYDALQRAFRNLIRNAVEAMAGSPRPLLVVEVRGRGPGLQVRVADNGRGIPVQHAARLFEPDFTLKAGGTGLGLAVVRQAVAAHGGSVTAHCRPEGGAEFVVELPGSPPEPAGSATLASTDGVNGSIDRAHGVNDE
jgi:nitrogen fixation/metabolism regulation signal transduction histidine kinase